ncbi:MAG: hypothetical protein QOJ54_36, partial [Aliidongia sp.]|nr:hypothetical protein [Aliidongia sp.]
MILPRLGWLALAVSALFGCSPRVPEPDRLVLERSDFAHLPGWRQDGPA